MSKTSLAFGFFCDVNQILISPSHLTGPLREKKKVAFRDLWLVDFDPFCVFLSLFLSMTSEFGRVFLKSRVRFALVIFFKSSFHWNMANLDRFYGASKCRRNIDMGGWKRIGTFPPTLTLICSFCLLLRHLFDKHSGCDRSNGFIDVTEKKNVFINGGRMLSKTDVTSANTSETVSRDRGKDWPIADWRVPSNDP